MTTRIYLIPGFFGFANLGDLRYFGHAHRYIERELHDRTIEGAVHEVPTRPSASLKQRATRLFDTIVETAGPEDDLHLVGHSSGGLDARLLTSPGTILDRSGVERIANQVKSVVCVATPNRGTPSAAIFSTLAGKRLLRLLSLITIVAIRRGGMPLEAMLSMARLYQRLDSLVDNEKGVMEEMFASLLDELTPERQASVLAFFSDVGEDQALLSQITPDGLDVFNATTANRPTTRYGCVVTRGARPGLISQASAGLSAQAQASHGIYQAIHRLASWSKTPELNNATAANLRAAWSDLATDDNDGMVPTWSQPWGKLIDAAKADHLDVIGHFSGEDLTPPHFDWMRSGSGYRRVAFVQTWSRVVDFQLQTGQFSAAEPENESTEKPL